MAVLTISDTRTVDTDESGKLAQALVQAAGHEITHYGILKDEPDQVSATVSKLLDEHVARVVITTGGTGIAARDSTYEAVSRLIEKRIDGFGELFRALSYREIGSAAMLSRAVAGTARSGFVFALPGSKAAVRLGLEQLILPELTHIAGLIG